MKNKTKQEPQKLTFLQFMIIHKLFTFLTLIVMIVLLTIIISYSSLHASGRKVYFNKQKISYTTLKLQREQNSEKFFYQMEDYKLYVLFNSREEKKNDKKEYDRYTITIYADTSMEKKVPKPGKKDEFDIKKEYQTIYQKLFARLMLKSTWTTTASEVKPGDKNSDSNLIYTSDGTPRTNNTITIEYDIKMPFRPLPLVKINNPYLFIELTTQKKNDKDPVVKYYRIDLNQFEDVVNYI